MIYVDEQEILLTPQKNRLNRGTTIRPPASKATDKASFLPMVHGKSTDALAGMVGMPIEVDRGNDTGVVKKGTTRLVIHGFDTLKQKRTLGVSTQKLLCTAVAKFTELNPTGTNTKERRVRFPDVYIPLMEYALDCGYDVAERETATEEEAKAESLRVKRLVDNARRKVKTDLGLLFSFAMTWEEEAKGKTKDYLDIRLIERQGIHNGYIVIGFSQSYCESLIDLPLTQFPRALLAVDERNIHAFRLGYRMSVHSNMDSNIKKGTAGLLKVKTLLGHTSLPDISTVRKGRKSWEERIKEPFEKSLEALMACGVLEDWEYSKRKGDLMTDEEASFTGYEAWAESLVHFTLKNAPDHTARLQARADENKARQTKKKKTRQTNKKKA